MMTKNKDINYAIVETTRPPIYTCLKYWGKKPHNVWNAYIKNYVPKGGVFFDPFAGSGMSGIEAVKAGKKAICFDINPLTTFVFDVMSSKFNKTLFETKALNVIELVDNDMTYKKFFKYEKNFTLHNAKYKNNQCYEICFLDSNNERHTRTPNDNDLLAITNQELIINNLLYPKEHFRESISYKKSFIKSIGNSYADLYTKRNLYCLSLIFNKILDVKEIDVELQLLYAFIQTVHLCTKMCIPRSKKTNRDFSTSWGRSAYFIAKTSMEMNPLLIFYNNCFGKQSTSSCLSYLKIYLKSFKSKKIQQDSGMIDISEDIDLWYGTINSKDLYKYISANSIDFVLTDPPYGGLVQYLDLSNIWLSWLSIYNEEYKPKYENEITINDTKNTIDFETDMTNVLHEIKEVLKDDSKLVLTFNNKNLTVWNCLLKAIQNSGFIIEKVIHQQNKRSGESNVNDRYGTSATDFYIRCIKSQSVNLKKITQDELSKIIIDSAKKIISMRFEPTPYQILLNGIIVAISESNISIDDVCQSIENVLESTINKEFIVIPNEETRAGNYWWIANKIFDKRNKNTLSNKLLCLINKIFNKEEQINEDELFNIIYKHFPNGMTPDYIIVQTILRKLCKKKGDLWIKK